MLTRSLLSLFLIGYLSGCKDEKDNYIAVSIYPLKLILNEIYEQPNVHVVVESITDPHTMDIPPKEILKLRRACTFMYFSDRLETWASKVDVSSKYSLHASDGDPHVWFVPKYILGKLDELVEHVKQTCGYTVSERKLELFKRNLETLDSLAFAKLKSLGNEPIILVHGAILPLLENYNVQVYAILFKHAYDVPPKLLLELKQLDSALVIKENFVSDEALSGLLKESFRIVEYDPFGTAYESYTDFMKELILRISQ